MSKLIDTLDHYGANTEEMMERFMNDEDLALECVIQFREDEEFIILAHAIENKEYQIAFEHAHALKGVAGNLSLIPLYTALCSLVEALRENSYSGIEQLLAKVIEEEVKFKAITKELK